MGKGRNCSSGAISPLIHNSLLPGIRFLCLKKNQISLRDKRLFDIIEVQITIVAYFETFERAYVLSIFTVKKFPSVNTISPSR